jgi:D-3-phosphoglycerate dehydrogenase
MDLLVTTYIPDEYKESLENLFDSVEQVGMVDKGRVLTEEELISAIKGKDVLLVEFDPVTEKVLEEAEDLKLIASVRGGAKANIDVEAANKRSIPIVNCPGRNCDTVADFTMGLMLSLSRGIAKAHKQIKDELITDEKHYYENGFCKGDVNWVGDTSEKFAYLQYKGPTLANKRLGLLGYGAIAREVAKRALAANMNVVAYDPYVDQNTIEQDVELVSMEEVMSSSDFISIHLRVTPETRNMLGRKELEMMKENTYFINTARAAVVDYDVLIELLQENKIKGAAFDVYPEEPLPPGHPLINLDNVVLTPHIGGASLDPYQRSYKMLLEDIERFLDNKEFKRLYNPEFKD